MTSIKRLAATLLLANQPIILFMATIGLTFFIEGLGETIWGSEIKPLNVGIPQDVWFVGDTMIQQADVFAAVVAGIWIGRLFGTPA